MLRLSSRPARRQLTARGDADKAAIQALENIYNEGFISKDVDKIMSVYAPGKQLFVFDVVRRANIKLGSLQEGLRRAVLGFPGSRQEHDLGTDHPCRRFVRLWTRRSGGRITAKDGTKMAVVVRTTDVYRKINGKWLIVEEHNSVPIDLETMKPDLLSKP